MKLSVDNNGNIICPECGCKEFTASIQAELNVNFYIYDYESGAYADTDKPQFDDYDLMDITCNRCNCVIADDYYTLNKEVKKKGEE